jgi:exodeoxyribonuclease-1
MNAEQLANAWRFKKDRAENDLALPVKTIRLNRCPAIAPLSVLSGSGDSCCSRLDLNLEMVAKHQSILQANHHSAFARELIKAVRILDEEQSIRHKSKESSVDARMYEGFYTSNDNDLLNQLHQNETADKVRSIRPIFKDQRLKQLSSPYLARNYPQQLTIEEREGWDSYVNRRLFSGEDNSQLALYFQALQQLAGERLDSKSQVLLEELKLYGESLIPSYTGD